MQTYRRYILNERGSILAGEWFEAQDDEDALERSRDHPSGRALEVWQQARQVGVVRTLRAASGK